MMPTDVHAAASPYFSTPVTQFSSLRLLSDSQEKVSRGTTDFPCCAYICDFGRVAAGIYPMHWHNELQFTVTGQNSLSVQVNSETVVLSPGEGIFINSRAFHSIESATPGSGERLDIIFEPNLLYGTHQSVFYQKYVSPLLGCRSLPYVKLPADSDFGRDMLAQFHRAFLACQAQPFGFELETRDALSAALLLICRNFRQEILASAGSSDSREIRVRQMVNYIYKNYQKPLTLGQIAASASVSERECFRCFHEILNTTPVAFLKRHRVTAALALLEDSSNTISDVCYLSGFNTPSYFIKSFREFMHCTPAEYRSLLAAGSRP